MQITKKLKFLEVVLEVREVTSLSYCCVKAASRQEGQWAIASMRLHKPQHFLCLFLSGCCGS